MKNKINVINEMKRVLKIQVASLNYVANHLGPSFTKAVEMIYKCKGKLIITGVGKSGYVAQKMAATLASTGTPALYLDPVEGMHGSLGIIGKNDIVLGLGKSGESEEVLNIIPSIRKIGAKLICMTGSRHSSLARASSLVLWVPVKQEACPLNLAPTTSSTVTMVIGDALAVALMKMRDFKEAHFALFHPGGVIGRRLLLKVSDIMRSGKRNPVVYVGSSVQALLIEITRKWTGAASIIDKKRRLVGLVTDYDIRRAFAEEKQISKMRINDLMNPNPIFIYSDDMAIKALQLMENRSKPLTILPVVDRQRRSVGMIHLHDLMEKRLVQS